MENSLSFFILSCHKVNTKLKLGSLPLFLHATAVGHVNYMTGLDKCFIKPLISNFGCMYFHVQLFTMESFFFTIRTSHYFLSIKNISPNLVTGRYSYLYLQKELRYKVHTESPWPSQESRFPETHCNTFSAKPLDLFFLSGMINL